VVCETVTRRWRRVRGLVSTSLVTNHLLEYQLFPVDGRRGAERLSVRSTQRHDSRQETRSVVPHRLLDTTRLLVRPPVVLLYNRTYGMY